jgi:hypothetical protein
MNDKTHMHVPTHVRDWTSLTSASLAGGGYSEQQTRSSLDQSRSGLEDVSGQKSQSRGVVISRSDVVSCPRMSRLASICAVEDGE